MEDNHSHINAITQSRISDELRFMTDGFADWVDRREHQRQRVTRTLIGITVLAAVTVTAVALLVPQNTDTFVSGDLQCCTTEACDRITIILAKI